MELILIIVVLVLLFGGGGYWGRSRGHWWGADSLTLLQASIIDLRRNIRD